MQSRPTITPAVLAAATGLLAPFVPSVTPQSLAEALQMIEHGDRPAAPPPEKPLTRQDAAALLSCSLNSVNRYMNAGLLRRVKIGKRTVRIDPASVRALLNNDGAEVMR